MHLRIMQAYAFCEIYTHIVTLMQLHVYTRSMQPGYYTFICSSLTYYASPQNPMHGADSALHRSIGCKAWYSGQKYAFLMRKLYQIIHLYENAKFVQELPLYLLKNGSTANGHPRSRFWASSG